ncbi:MAG: hypothetical protein FWD13_07065 [Treponema sp.]|nr:hypothetical protein [Treponema sp.]
MINEKQLEDLAKIETASWAIWSDVNNKEYCKENIKSLKNNVVFVGLNRSGNKDSKSNPKNNIFKNFHTFGHKGDGLLKDTISNLDFLKGAYMTDISNKIESNENNVRIEKEAKVNFEKQLDILGADKFTIICFGAKVLNFFIKEYGIKTKLKENKYKVKELTITTGNKILNLYGIRHYSYRFGKKEVFENQLKYINDELKK